ncbi:PPE family protein [Mycobacterium kansasii]|uniref:PPE family protein n=4 Tax=Mycobacterium kansasii TaxID=1768 RepID=A0A1V3X0R4_MYCKA|nr:PPE family protein [Mycobacterium kansasii]
MSFSMLAPEVNSARIFAGAGTGPMLAAAAAWDRLASELDTAARSFGSVIGTLAGQSWLGSAAAAMSAAAVPYADWLSASAAHAQRAAEQALATAAGYEAARSASVPPTLVAANRTRLVSLVLTNLFGQHAPAIAATEAHYERMWAQDVAAMADYRAGAAAVAAQLGIGNIGSHNLGSGNIGNHNLGSGNIGNANVGSGNTGNANLGSGNFGNANVGSGNGNHVLGVSSNFNVGSGNFGDHNVGFGNAGLAGAGGNGNVGNGLTGTNQIGVGG